MGWHKPCQTQERTRRFLKVLKISIAVALVGFGLPILLCLSSLSEPASLAFLIFWLFSFAFDVYTTWRFYMDDPGKFESRELSAMFKRLNAKLGFEKAVFVFILAVEIPAGLLISFVGAPAVAGTIRVRSTAACLAAGFGLLGFIHLYAAVRNLAIEASEGRRP
jgi:hypothetical protein